MLSHFCNAFAKAPLLSLLPIIGTLGSLSAPPLTQDAALLDVLMQCSREQALQQFFASTELSVSHISSSFGRLGAVFINS